MDPDISKLPKWAQSHIRRLERQRQEAIDSLNQYINAQTPSSIYFDDMISTGEQPGPSFKRVYIQSRKITYEHAGVKLEVYLREDAINLRWETQKSITGVVAFVPQSFQNAHLIAPENMR